MSHEILNRHAPIRQKRVKFNRIPWITPAIKLLVRTKDYYKKKAIKFNSTIDWKKYQLLKDKVNIQLRSSKDNFFHNGFEDCAKKRNIKKSWSLINSLTGKKSKFSNITEISTNDRNIVDPAQIAECFNDYFVNIGS